MAMTWLGVVFGLTGCTKLATKGAFKGAAKGSQDLFDETPTPAPEPRHETVLISESFETVIPPQSSLGISLIREGSFTDSGFQSPETTNVSYEFEVVSGPSIDVMLFEDEEHQSWLEGFDANYNREASVFNQKSEKVLARVPNTGYILTFYNSSDESVQISVVPPYAI
ncbi:hypothetical protein [Haladaptatus sp. ZSTT2]|uniref:hypothetical protein n=1 Tax=Haladaptatus sp. ZSTT2 TaxID=3120515 RepID=UPI00300E7A23